MACGYGPKSEGLCTYEDHVWLWIFATVHLRCEVMLYMITAEALSAECAYYCLFNGAHITTAAMKELHMSMMILR